MPLGPVITDIEGTSLNAEDTALLQHPQVGGVILFSRNYESPSQLQALTAEIKALDSELLITIDQEGGRVQRAREGLTTLPPFAAIGRLYQQDPSAGLAAARASSWVMASELRALGVDLSFTPVLDIDRQLNTVIGDRSFAEQPKMIIALSKAYIDGLHDAGMVAIGKHFPGHGGVVGDSHHELPVDERAFETLFAEDIVPFAELIKQQQLAGVMPAHIVYPHVDSMPAGFSEVWLQQILRSRLQFDGVIFSDDLTMEGASIAGDYPARADAALAAGCDILLVCNNRGGAIAVTQHLDSIDYPVNDNLYQPLRKPARLSWQALTKDPYWQEATALLASLATPT
ncbi:MAG: beta-N-acetylhexosaminidase [Legionellales bacterium]|nr:beta-N-acetylhexosaminidase [Legionellales bacterium]|tara:strand:- start:2603 stop:3631 length:1029 start_codon:yes stop_codon:yes gene_type:complete